MYVASFQLIELLLNSYWNYFKQLLELLLYTIMLVSIKSNILLFNAVFLWILFVHEVWCKLSLKKSTIIKMACYK